MYIIMDENNEKTAKLNTTIRDSVWNNPTSKIDPNYLIFTLPDNTSMDTSSKENFDNRGTADNIHHNYDIGVIIVVTVQVILMILICSGNILVIYTFYRRRQLKTVTNFLITHLAFADLSVGLSLPFHMAILLYPVLLQNIIACVFRYCVLLMSVSGTYICLLLITYDRYSAILWPLTTRDERERFSLPQAVILVFTIWTLPIGIGFILPMLWHNDTTNLVGYKCDLVKVLKLDYLRFCICPFFLATSTVMVYMYIHIYYKSRSHFNRLARTSITTDQINGQSLHGNLTLAKTSALVLGLFFLCWLPFYITLMLQIYGDLNLPRTTTLEIRTIAMLLGITNSAINPFIYAWRLKDFRNEAKTICLRKRFSPNMVLVNRQSSSRRSSTNTMYRTVSTRASHDETITESFRVTSL